MISIHPQVEYAGYANVKGIDKGSNIQNWTVDYPAIRPIKHAHGKRFVERTAKHLTEVIPKIFNALFKKWLAGGI